MGFKKMYCRAILTCAFVAGIISSAGAAAQQVYKLVAQENSKIEIEGDSTLHRWHANSVESIIDSEIILAPGLEANAEKGAVLNTIVLPSLEKKFVLTVPIKTLASGIPGLAGKIHSALNYKKYPDIVFKLTSYEVTASTAQKNVFNIKAEGMLTICEQSRKITLNLAADTGKGVIKVTGETQLLMTDYGVKPPRMLMIKAADEVVVKWDLLLDIKEVK